jgi:hypothetical protein
MESIHAMLMRSQLRWAGHVVRMNDERLPKRLFYGELCSGKRSCGGQKKRFKDYLKTSIKHCNIDSRSWEELALDRTAWRCQTNTGIKVFEKRKIMLNNQKRQERNENLTIPSLYRVSHS